MLNSLLSQFTSSSSKTSEASESAEKTTSTPSTSSKRPRETSESPEAELTRKREKSPSYQQVPNRQGLKTNIPQPNFTEDAIFAKPGTHIRLDTT
jgi:hypothetical protein